MNVFEGWSKVRYIVIRNVKFWWLNCERGLMYVCMYVWCFHVDVCQQKHSHWTYFVWSLGVPIASGKKPNPLFCPFPQLLISLSLSNILWKYAMWHQSIDNKNESDKQERGNWKTYTTPWMPTYHAPLQGGGQPPHPPLIFLCLILISLYEMTLLPIGRLSFPLGQKFNLMTEAGFLISSTLNTILISTFPQILTTII